jgi:hypothetical protein
LGVIRGEDYKSDEWGTTTTEETKDTPGATSSKDHVKINMIRIKMIKVKDDEDSEDFELVQTDEEQKNKKKSRTVTLLFIYNPSCIFFNSVYTESIYSFLTFSSFLILLKLYKNGRFDLY